MTLQPVRGMRDFYPEDMRKREWLFSVWREASLLYGFEPYDAPVVENLDLLKRKAGEEIAEQLYSFKDKSGREIALRAEMTPSLARMIASRQNSIAMPAKWYAIAQCFRYERMTKGRKREHYQWNADILGVDDVSAETEIISLLIFALKKMGFGTEDVVVRINSRKIIEDILRKVGVPSELFSQTMIVIDKKDKIPSEELKRMLGEVPLKGDIPERLLDAVEKCSEGGAREFLGDGENIRQMDDLIENLGDFSEFVSFDVSVVRGLSYYTGIVFEAFGKRAGKRAIAGGGRYASLLEKIGGAPLSGVGFGFGDVVILDVLEESEKIPFTGINLDYYIIPYSKDYLSYAFSIARQIRNKGFSADIDFKCRKVKTALSDGSKKNALFCVMIFPEEHKDGRIKLKNMKTKEEKTLSAAEFFDSSIST